MAGWQDELTELLGMLGVTPEEPQPQSRSQRKPSQSKSKNAGKASPRRSYADALHPSVEASILRDIVSSADEDELDPWLDDLEEMRREVDTIVRQVIRLIQHGDLDPSLKEDVMIVLRALRRRATATRQAGNSDEAYLEASTSMLHFCRIILRLDEGDM
jgi:hypothetical protein